MRNLTTENFELIYTGGGIYIAQYTDDGYVYTVDSDCPGILTLYENHGDDTYYDEYVAWSVPAKEIKGNAYDRMIYDVLYSMLVDESAVTDLETVPGKFSHEELNIINTSIMNVLSTTEMPADYEQLMKDTLNKVRSLIEKLEGGC